jgi:two-component system, NtrC family, sensor kinase
VKQKLVAGLGLITLIFIVSGVFILKNLHVITSIHEMKEHQEEVIGRYNNILMDLKNAQAELYRHQAGYTRDINVLVDSILELEELLILTGEDFTGHIGNTSCNDCHSAQGQIDTLNAMTGEIHLLLRAYKEKISRIITLRDFELSRSLDESATRDGDEIIARMKVIYHAALKMKEQMEDSEMASVSRAIYSIMTAIAVSVMLSIFIVILLIRSITGPVHMLVKGIENVASGNYEARVDISSADEIGFLAKTFNDMTENLNQTSLQKESLMLELRELNNDLERRIEEAKEELRVTHERMLHSETLSVVGTFASGVAHELATPLSSIISYFRMIRETLTAQEELGEDVEIIEAELLRCRNILRGMLNFARTPEKDKILTDVNSIIRDLLSLVKYQTEFKKKIEITENLNPQLPPVMAVPGQLRQVFMNIIINAIQSMPSGGNVTVSSFTIEDGSRLAISISDTGCGIPEDALNKIFHPFYTSKDSGTGLGLSISYGMIKSHGGDIEVESEFGSGTTFSVYLPVTVDSKQ